ncbi:hypothetical protein HDA32_002334 [Spinactinospora alkalitolerans]|uniref:Uncharacterized protein n=1 Tax=Spinactinospora alkalitolerans TaxID=687207 RepID=A0A852TZ17_9ACTN|nr:hypothetical protein [Spinactinospora alkalitolerans]NYE47214.1 hypothetical protein [Spinactinospora alkalitolerans]
MTAPVSAPHSRTSSIAWYAEVALPGVAVGAVAGLFAAGVAALAGLPAALALTIAASLGGPLALFGGAYCVLLATGRFRVGTVAPVALYWMVCFPLARLIEEFAAAQVLGNRTVLGEPLWSFLVFQAMLSVGFAIGFLWLHERLAPHWLMRIRPRNPVAADLAERYLEHMNTMVRRRPSAAAARRRSST